MFIVEQQENDEVYQKFIEQHQISTQELMFMGMLCEVLGDYEDSFAKTKFIT